MFEFFVGQTPTMDLQATERLQNGGTRPLNLAALGLPVSVVLLGPKPAGAGARPRVVKTPSYVTDGSDGWVRFACAAADLSAAGLWQATVVPASADLSQNFPGEPVLFLVKAAL